MNIKQDITKEIKLPRCKQMTRLRTLKINSSCSLPPIANEEACNTNLIISLAEHKSEMTEQYRSRNHSGCKPKNSLYLDWKSTKPEHYKGRIPIRVKAKSMTSFSDVAVSDVYDLLKRNKKFLEDYVLEHVSVKQLEMWINKKSSCNNPSPSTFEKSITNSKQKGLAPEKEIFMDLLKCVSDHATEHSVVIQLASYIATTVGTHAHRLYKLYPDHPVFVQYFESDKESKTNLIPLEPKDVTLVLEVAKAGTCYRLSRADDPQKFPNPPAELFKRNMVANHVMYQPILAKNGRTAYVIEMWRKKDRFKRIDEEVSSNFLVLGSVALHYCNLYLDKKRERNMTDFLLDVVKAIFEEMVSLDQLIKRILEFAQRLVNADRASLFLVDHRNFELVSTVFDLKFEPGLDRDMEKKEIRMPISRGIAGHVALSGETMNIPDAYSDYRFNREVDETTGYKTVSILCMPIKVEGKVIGVVQMVNKRNENSFGHEDEVSFEVFSTFFGLALHHARLYDRIMRKEQKYRVALEVLSYHNTCKEHEVITMLEDTKHIDIELNDFYLNPYIFSEFEKCKCVISMFSDLFDLSIFDLSILTRFVLTVKKNYRTVPYHNFDHGWTVAHSMFVILKNDYRKRFNYKMRLALFVACLCHDLDHRGYTNKYMSEIASPLAAMYTTSTLEHHHFNITVTILQQDGHNIFSHISSEDYKEILGYIRHCILATDLAAFFPNLKKINQLHEGDCPQFTWDLHSHRELAMAISMTAADLSASAKPWEVQIKTVQVIFEEFYDQGDKEKAIGREPIPMMDRNKPDEQPASQVGFLSQICVPCYSVLYRILPNTRPMYAMASKNLKRWQLRADKVKQNIALSPLDFTDSSDVKNDNIPEKDVKIDEQDTNIEDAIKIDDFVDTKIETAVKIDYVDTKVEKQSVVEDDSDWEEDDDTDIKENELSGHGIWRNLEGDTWIDEDGVVVSKKALKAIIKGKQGKHCA